MGTRSLLEGKSEAARLEEELMTARLTEVESQAELKDQRLKIMDLETHVRGPIVLKPKEPHSSFPMR